MAGPEIVNIVSTVAIVQLCCDLMANQFSFKTDKYKRLARHYERCQERYAALEKSEKGKETEKSLKRLDVAKKEKQVAAADLSRVHMIPQFFTSIIFLMLYRIFVTEYFGKVIGFIPFVPYKLLRRVSLRGLDDIGDFSETESLLVGDHKQACSFLVIYMLSALSVKYFVSRAVAIKPPKGAGGGLLAHMDSPQNQKILKQFGLDNESNGL